MSLEGPIRAAVAAGFVACGLAAGASTAPAEDVPGGDWPTYRHDVALSAVSPLKGGLGRAPRVAWSVDLGGPRVPSETVLVRDATGDGRDEILILADDAVECRDARGRRLWRLDGYPRPAVVDIRDYAGDGSRGILLTTTRGGRVERSGGVRVLWPVALGRRVGEPVLADLDGDDHAEILVGAEDGRLYCLRGDRAAGD